MPSLRDSSLLPYLTRHFRAGLLLVPSPAGTGYSFTVKYGLFPLIACSPVRPQDFILRGSVPSLRDSSLLS